MALPILALYFQTGITKRAAGHITKAKVKHAAMTVNVPS